jgi:hypothetical protein
VPWFTVDDRFHNNAKTAIVLAAGERGRAAIGLWTIAGAWCMDELTDGFVPKARVLMFGWRKTHADLLVEAGLWHAVDGGYRFHQWLDRNPSKAQVLHTRAETARRVKEHRDRTRNGVSPPRQQRLSNVPVTPIRNGVSNGRSQIPDPRSQADQDRKRVEDLDPPDPRARAGKSPDSRLVLDPDSDGKAERASELLERFERVVHDGKRVADRERCLSLLGDMLPALVDRAPDDPAGLFERVLTLYNADRRSRSKTPTVELFGRDFAAWAQRESEQPSSRATRADRAQRLMAELADARRRKRAATDDAARTAADIAIGDVERALVSLGIHPDDVDDLEQLDEASP